eukprot:3702634-Pyramimonas_sp.AAC.1
MRQDDIAIKLAGRVDLDGKMLRMRSANHPFQKIAPFWATGNMGGKSMRQTLFSAPPTIIHFAHWPC